MIDCSDQALHALHVRAVELVAQAGMPCPLRFASELRDVHQAANVASRELASALSVAARVGCFEQVAAVVHPAQRALQALIEGIADEQRCRREVERAAG